MAWEVDFTSLDPTDTSAAQAPRQGTRWWSRVHLPNEDCTGIVARMQLRRQPKDPTFVLELTEDNGRLVWDARGSNNTEAILRIDVSAEDMALLDPKVFKYDLEFVPGGDEALAFAQMFGKVAVQPQVTR